MDLPAMPLDLGVLDALDSGVVVLDARRRIRHWNAWMARASGLASTDVAARDLLEVVPSADAALQEAVRQAIADGLPRQLSDALHGRVFPLAGPDGEPLIHSVVVRPLSPGPDRLCLIQVQDVTLRRRAEAALRQSERRVRAQLDELETIYRTAPIGLALLDRSLRFLRVNEAMAEINGMPVAEHLGRNAWDVAPALRETAEPHLLRVFEAGESVRHVELRGTTPREPGVERVWIMDVYPVKRLDGAVVAVGAIAREITEQRRLEARERLLGLELRHRIKNSFAMVDALARQTVRSTATVPEFLEAFSGRLRALASAQDLMVDGPGRGSVGLPELARAALAPFTDSDASATLELEDVAVPADLATDLALALHELATNSTKYGALSSKGGRVVLTGGIRDAEDGRALALVWQESGGPPVRRPDRRGFGTQLLERSIGLQHDGRVELDWQEAGLVCRILVPCGRWPEERRPA